MQTYTITLDDGLVGKVSSQFATHASMQDWLQNEVELIVIHHAEAMNKNEAKGRTHSVAKELERLSATKPTKSNFFKLGEILPPSKHSDKELLQGYLKDKYGL